MTLKVKPLSTIYEIKTQIESVKEIPIKDQVLTMNGASLANNEKLFRTQIENSVLWLSYKSEEISVHLFRNSCIELETIRLKVQWIETIWQIKSLIAKKKDIPINAQNMYLGYGVWTKKTKLRDDESLADNEISKRVFKDGISLMIGGSIFVYDDNGHNPKDLFEFRHGYKESVPKTQRPKTLKIPITRGTHFFIYDIEVEAFDTIKDVKMKAYAMQYNQQLQLNSQLEKFSSVFFGTKKESNLYIADCQLESLGDEDEKTVYDYGLKKFFNGEFVLTGTPLEYRKMSIFVKMLDGKTIRLDCFEFTMIEKLKLKIQEKEGVPQNKLNLAFLGKRLKNNESLADYNITKESTIHALSLSLT